MVRTHTTSFAIPASLFFFLKLGNVWSGSPELVQGARGMENCNSLSEGPGIFEGYFSFSRGAKVDVFALVHLGDVLDGGHWQASLIRPEGPLTGEPQFITRSFCSHFWRIEEGSSGSRHTLSVCMCPLLFFSFFLLFVFYLIPQSERFWAETTKRRTINKES